jgi:hypothetical protein
VLPALEHELQAVAVGIEHVAGVIARVVIQTRTGCPLSVALALIAAE